MTASRRLLPLLGGAALVILGQQVVDLWVALQGSDLGLPAGRLRSLLAVSSRALPVLCADILLVASLLGGGARRRLAVLGVLHWLAALGLLAALPLLLHDAAPVSEGLSGGALRSLQVTVLRLLLVLPGFALLSLLAGRALRRVSRTSA